MTLKDLYNYVLENNGATFCAVTKELFNPKDGFMVSNEDSEIIIYKEELTFSKFAEIIDGMVLFENEYVGIWINDNKVYFDTSTHWSNLAFALIEGMVNNQKAIWDFKQDAAIELPTNQRNGTHTQKLAYRKQAVEKMVASYPECKWY